MESNIAESLIRESLDKVAGVNGKTAEPSDKIIVVMVALFAKENAKSKRAKVMDAAIPVGGVSVVVGVFLGV